MKKSILVIGSRIQLVLQERHFARAKFHCFESFKAAHMRTSNNLRVSIEQSSREENQKSSCYVDWAISRILKSSSQAEYGVSGEILIVLTQVLLDETFHSLSCFGS